MKPQARAVVAEPRRVLVPPQPVAKPQAGPLPAPQPLQVLQVLQMLRTLQALQALQARQAAAGPGSQLLASQVQRRRAQVTLAQVAGPGPQLASQVQHRRPYQRMEIMLRDSSRDASDSLTSRSPAGRIGKWASGRHAKLSLMFSLAVQQAKPTGREESKQRSEDVGTRC